MFPANGTEQYQPSPPSQTIGFYFQYRTRLAPYVNQQNIQEPENVMLVAEVSGQDEGNLPSLP